MKCTLNKLYIAVLLVELVAVQAQLNSIQKDELLDVHNYFRGNTDPPAADMLRMVWNDELANVAQSYSSRCMFAHNPNRSQQSPSFSYVGENLALTTGATNYTQLVELWHNERADYTYSSNTCAQGKVCGHYTQLVWSSSRSLGCGATRCPSLVAGDRTIPNGLLLVCNYGPGGNFKGQLPYSFSGVRCTSCPSNYPHCVQGLCHDNVATTIAPTSTPSEAGSKDPLRANIATVKGEEGMCPSSDTLDSEIRKLRDEIARLLQGNRVE